MERKFQLGDRVRIKGGNLRERIGEVVIIDHRGPTYGIEVSGVEGFSTDELAKWEKYTNCSTHIPNRTRSGWVSESRLQHAKIANTEIARKLYPHYEENGEWLMIKEKHG